MLDNWVSAGLVLVSLVFLLWVLLIEASGMTLNGLL
jgi:hypothetical protein